MHFHVPLLWAHEPRICTWLTLSASHINPWRGNRTITECAGCRHMEPERHGQRCCLPRIQAIEYFSMAWLYRIVVSFHEILMIWKIVCNEGFARDMMRWNGSGCWFCHSRHQPNRTIEIVICKGVFQHDIALEFMARSSNSRFFGSPIQMFLVLQTKNQSSLIHRFGFGIGGFEKQYALINVHLITRDDCRYYRY